MSAWHITLEWREPDRIEWETTVSPPRDATLGDTVDAAIKIATERFGVSGEPQAVRAEYLLHAFGGAS